MRYWAYVSRRAFWETLAILGFQNRLRAFVAFVVWLLAVVLLGLFFGQETDMIAEVRWMVAVLAAAAIMFVPIFVGKLVAIPASIDSTQRAAIDKLRGLGDDISQAISLLRQQSTTKHSLLGGTELQEYREDFADLLEVEFADVLAIHGITPSNWQGEYYKGLSNSQLNRFLSDLRIQGIVEVRHRTVERDRGYPYTVTDFFLSDFGSRVVARLQKESAEQWAEEYPDD